jgi:hypothetical protein
MMKATLLLSALAAGLLAVSTTTFAQNFVNYPQAYGSATSGAAPSWGYTAPAKRFTRSDFGYRGNVTVTPHKTTHPHATAVAAPVPAQGK